ncbi:Signal peptidase complex subunit [Kappamyces sp. JEL0680]|nr:Signal peptidase complex subunit [Kappamyces sp. JEL0680]
MGLAALSHVYLVLLHPESVPSASRLVANTIKMKPQRIGRDFKAKKPTLAKITFDMKADLSPLFNWNTKMLFVSVLAEFANDQYGFNQACIWDDVIMNKEDAVFNFKKKPAEYPIHDLADKLAGSKANLTLQYQIIPWVGIFLQDRVGFKEALVFPSAV